MLTYFSLRDAFSVLHITYHGRNFTVLNVILQLLSAFSCRLSALGVGVEAVSDFAYYYYYYFISSALSVIYST